MTKAATFPKCLEEKLRAPSRYSLSRSDRQVPCGRPLGIVIETAHAPSSYHGANATPARCHPPHDCQVGAIAWQLRAPKTSFLISRSSRDHIMDGKIRE